VYIRGKRAGIWLFRDRLAERGGQAVETASTAEGSALGAGILAMVGIGWYDSVAAACEAWIGRGDVTGVSDDRARYADLYPVYRTLYPTLHDIFPQLV
jgi:sugar (pentulose or hexulose) kinase